MDGSPIVARGGASLSPTSPVSGPKRKRSGPVKHESSPGSGLEDDHGDHGDHDKKRQPGVKRACNECRQQKVSCIGIKDGRASHHHSTSFLHPFARLYANRQSFLLSFCKAAVRRCAATISELLSVQPFKARMQDRVQLQTSWQALQARRDGKRD